MKARIPLSEYIFKIGVIVSALTGISLQIHARGGFMSGTVQFWYFTIQSNMWIAGICLIFILLQLFAPQKLTKPLFAIKFMLTIAILLTFIVFAVLLAPFMTVDYLLSLSNFCLHFITPLFAAADFILCDHRGGLSKRIIPIGLIMPLMYFVVILIASMNGVRFHGGVVPYFFMDYQKYGWFSFRQNGIGVFYWIVLLAGLLFLMGSVLFKWTAKRRKHLETREGMRD